MSGVLSWPTALITARAVSVSVTASADSTSTDHVASSSSQVAVVTPVLNRTCSSILAAFHHVWK
jgi:hypothetical protein